jgi:hypothetical protein
MITVTNASVEEVEFTGGEGITFRATVSLDLDGVSDDPDGGWTSSFSDSCEVTGYWSDHGFEISRVR